jgi:hypothetical protein
MAKACSFLLLYRRSGWDAVVHRFVRLGRYADDNWTFFRSDSFDTYGTHFMETAIQRMITRHYHGEILPFDHATDLATDSEGTCG